MPGKNELTMDRSASTSENARDLIEEIQVGSERYSSETMEKKDAMTRSERERGQ